MGNPDCATMQIIEGATQTVERAIGKKIESGTAVFGNILHKGTVLQTLIKPNWRTVRH